MAFLDGVLLAIHGRNWVRKHNTICLHENSPFAGTPPALFILASLLAIYSKSMYVSYSSTFYNLRMLSFEWTRAPI
jgi:hypothetical protein